MNAIFLSAPNKSLRQMPHPSYTHSVESHAQAPQRRLFHFSGALLTFTRAAKPSIFNNLHTLKFGLSASCSFLNICPLSEKHRGYTPTLPISEPPPCSRVRFPDRGPFHLILARYHPQPNPTHHSRLPISSRPRSPQHPTGGTRFSLAIKKQSAPHSTETHPRLTTFSGYPQTRSATPQETDR